VYDDHAARAHSGTFPTDVILSGATEGSAVEEPVLSAAEGTCFFFDLTQILAPYPERSEGWEAESLTAPLFCFLVRRVPPLLSAGIAGPQFLGPGRYKIDIE